MKKLIGLILLLLVLLAACSDAESEATYTIEEAKENGDVIVEHMTEDFDQIRQGALEIENIKQITTLLEKVEKGEEYSTNIAIFNPDNSSYQNSLTYNGNPSHLKTTSEATSNHQKAPTPAASSTNALTLSMQVTANQKTGRATPP